jgi:peptide-methionine (R)-S-oxide reductase
MAKDDGWDQELTKDQYKVLREKGTEPPFSGKYLKNKQDGIYVCAGCGAELFDSRTKYDSGTGWPSFYDVIESGAIELRSDLSAGMKRTEAKCKKCGGHLGHVFDDGPTPTNQRYCINSLALDFEQKDVEKT